MAQVQLKTSTEEFRWQKQELFKAVSREKELDQEILAFSILYNASNIIIYGHYASIKDYAAKFYRYPIRFFSFAEPNGKYKWTAYQFTKNVCFHFMLKLHKLICSAIDQMSLAVAPQPPLSVNVMLKQQVEELKQQISGGDGPSFATLRMLLEELERQRQDNERLRKNAHSGSEPEVVTMLRQELERQRRESKEQLE
ncbi:MAG: hypothetical protein Q9163_002927 [Psora crenata]